MMNNEVYEQKYFQITNVGFLLKYFEGLHEYFRGFFSKRHLIKNRDERESKFEN